MHVLVEEAVVLCTHLKTTEPELGFCFHRETECEAETYNDLVQCVDYEQRIRKGDIHGD